MISTRKVEIADVLSLILGIAAVAVLVVGFVAASVVVVWVAVACRWCTRR